MGLRKRNAIDNILVIFYCLHRISILRFLDLKYFLNCLLIPSPSDHPNTGIEPRFPTLQAGSLPAVPQGSPRLLEWVVYPFARGSSQPRNRTGVLCIAGGFFTNWFIKEAHEQGCLWQIRFFFPSLFANSKYNPSTNCIF